MKRLKISLVWVMVGVVVLASALGGALADRLFVIKPLDLIFKRDAVGKTIVKEQTKIVNEEGGVVETVQKVSDSVVTVSITKEQIQANRDMFFDPFGFFGYIPPSTQDGEARKIKQDIGSGFVVEEDGMIVTNKHVVGDQGATYRVITKDNKEYEVKKIYRDPVNDLAILKIDAKLPPLELGDSNNLKVGQFVIAIGTALGEFRHTVTTGVISGLGRGIDASAGFGALAERLDGVIQTDAAINPGNSGGPLLDSQGKVIGVNVAVASGAQNVGFALPIDVIKESLKQFDQTGKFSRPFVGVRYKMISKEVAVLNDLVSGAYIIEVMEGSSAMEAGLKPGDVITKLGGEAIDPQDLASLTKIITKHKVGEKLKIEFVRAGNKQSAEVELKEEQP